MLLTGCSSTESISSSDYNIKLFFFDMKYKIVY